MPSIPGTMILTTAPFPIFRLGAQPCLLKILGRRDAFAFFDCMVFFLIQDGRFPLCPNVVLSAFDKLLMRFRVAQNRPLSS